MTDMNEPRIIAAAGVAFAAYLTWLFIRLVNRREKWAIRLAIATALAFAYPALLGPCCWISSRTGYGAKVVNRVYQPLMQWFAATADADEPGLVQRQLEWYSQVGAKADWYWTPVYALETGLNFADDDEGGPVPFVQAGWMWTEWDTSSMPGCSIF